MKARNDANFRKKKGSFFFRLNISNDMFGMYYLFEKSQVIKPSISFLFQSRLALARGLKEK